MGKCKTKAILTGLDTFRNNLAYTGIIQAYSKPCLTLAYLGPWYIQNPDIFKIRNIFRTLVYSQLWHIQNLRLIPTSTMSSIYDEAFRENSYRKIVSQYKLATFSTSWNKYHDVVTPEVAIQCKKINNTKGIGDREFLI